MHTRMTSGCLILATVALGPGLRAQGRPAVPVNALADPRDPRDVEAANRLQDAIEVGQANAGSFEVPNWDQASQTKVHEALLALGALGGTRERFGRKDEVDPISHLIGTAIGWGGNPRYAAIYEDAPPDIGH